jgi:hypothetical protein
LNKVIWTEINVKGKTDMSGVNVNCSCPFVTCKIHGLCGECAAAHKGKTFCKSPRLLQKFFRLIGNLQRKNMNQPRTDQTEEEIFDREPH